MAKAAGVDYIWNDKNVRIDMRTKTGQQINKMGIGPEVGIGQYSVTVLDHANGMATFAANGVRADAHFVMKMLDLSIPNKDPSKDPNKQVVYSEKLPDGKQKILLQPAIDDLSDTLKKVEAGHLDDGQDAAGKTGTWQYKDSTEENAHAWMVGYTKNLAAAVWVGNKAEEKPLILKDDRKVYGATIPGPIWRDFMVGATKAMKLQPEEFAPPKYIGDEGAGNTPSPKPKEKPTRDPRCMFPGTCNTATPQATTQPTNGPGNPGGGGGGGGGGGPGGGGDVILTPAPAALNRRD
jgi:membrane peptidoglycan carboxypeptidase